MANFDRRKIRNLLVAVLIVQAVYWLIAYPLLDHRPDFAGMSRFKTVEVAPLAAPTSEAIRAAKFETVEAPWSDCCSGGYRAVRYTFSLKQVPFHGILVGAPGQGDNRQIYVNEGFFYGRGRMDSHNPTYHANLPGFFQIPPAMLKLGENKIDVVLVRSAMPWFDAGSMIYGDAGSSEAAFAARQFALNDVVVFNIGVGFVLSFLAMFVAVRSQERTLPAWMALLLLTWVLNAAFYRWVDPGFSPYQRMVYYFALLTFVPVCWFGLIIAWTKLKWRWSLLLVLVTWVMVIGSIALLANSGDGKWFDTASLIADYFRLPIIILTIGVFVYAIMRRSTDDRNWEAAILILCMVLLAAEAYWELRWQKPLGQMQVGLVFFMLALMVAFISRNIRLFRSSEALASMLSGQLTERTSELEAAHARESGVIRLQAHLQERQRIMRDMHDGLGSQLMSMLLMAKRGQAEPKNVAEGLQSVIDEMRLMIDSMDSVGESLSTAFSIFRERVQSRVEAAGFVFRWDNKAEGNLPDYGPRDVLQVFRVMQEAVTNALKHSTGKEIAVSIAPVADADYPLQIMVTDNGGGMGGANPRGRGLANMQGRAESIGGKVDFQSSDKGVSVVLTLPQQSKRDV